MAWINRTKVAKFGSMVSINDAIGISHLERFKEYNLGNYVNLKIHWHKNTTVTRPVIEEAIKFCVENKIYFSFSEFLDRYTFVPWKILDTLTKEIYELATEEYNINSPSQTAHILFDVLGSITLLLKAAINLLLISSIVSTSKSSIDS